MNQPGDPPDDLMTVAQVANHYGVNSATVPRWVRAGRLPVALITLGGHRRFRRSDVIAPTKPGDQAPQPDP